MGRRAEAKSPKRCCNDASTGNGFWEETAVVSDVFFLPPQAVKAAITTRRKTDLCSFCSAVALKYVFDFGIFLCKNESEITKKLHYGRENAALLVFFNVVVRYRLRRKSPMITS